MKIYGRISLTAVVLIVQFLALPSSAQVNVIPNEAVAGLGDTTAFICTSFSGQDENFEWLINGTSVNDGQYEDIVTVIQGTTLQFIRVLAEYNHTRIECRIDSVLSVEHATLLVQGFLAAVGSLLVNVHVDHIYVNWTAPFSLDITRTSVDITYCVDVVSFASSATLHSECGITETEFTYPLPPRIACDDYNFTVTPVNTAGNGTSNFGYQIPPAINLELVEYSVSTTNTTTSFFFVMTYSVCRATVTFTNIYDEDESITVKDTLLAVSQTNISGSQDLKLNSLYGIVFSASNIYDFFSVSSAKIISTYDIIGCSAFQFNENIVILVNFVQHTEATGALLNFIYINEDGTVDFSMSFSRAIEKSRDLQNVTVSLNMSYPGNYIVYAYDIERDQQIVDGLNYQASTCNFSVSDRQVEEISSLPPQKSSCIVHSRSQVIYIQCQSLSRFQVTAQINDSRKVNILHVNSSSQSIASVETSQNGDYLLTILPIQDGKGILSGTTFSYIHSVAEEMVTAEEIVTLGTSSFAPSSRGPEVAASECRTQTSILLLILLDIVNVASSLGLL